MASPFSDDDTDPATATRRAYTLYVAQGRIYANNESSQKLVDLGGVSESDSGYRYVLDGNGMTGERLPDPQSVLRDIGERIRFLFLDGQFTALADMRGNDAVNLDGAPQLRIELDELKPGEPIQDASV